MISRSRDRQALVPLAILGALFGLMLTVTWQRWMHPFIDHGREANVPLRLLQGERLYVDIFYHYGPLAPYLVAGLYRCFGVSLSVVHAAGAVAGATTLLLLYSVARSLLSATESTIVVAIILITSAFSPIFSNYVQPYSYAALFGWMFAVSSLALLLRYAAGHRIHLLLAAGVSAGFACAFKPELLLLGVIPGSALLGLEAIAVRRIALVHVLAFFAPAAAIIALTYVPLLVTVPWQVLVGDTAVSFRQPQLMSFSRVLSGTDDVGHSLIASTLAVGPLLCFGGLCALAGTSDERGTTTGGRRRAIAVLVVGVALTASMAVFSSTAEWTPLASAPIVLSVIVASAGWRLLRQAIGKSRLDRLGVFLLLIVLFSLVSISRVVLRVAFVSAYAGVTTPVVIIAYAYLGLRFIPSQLVTSPKSLRHARRLGTVLLISGMVVVGVSYVRTARVLNDAQISAPRGTLLTRREFAEPYNDAIAFVRKNTSPSDYVVSVPQGTLINFLAERRNPLRDENIVPGWLTPDRETDAIRRMLVHNVSVVLVSNILTYEYGESAFGRDYNHRLMNWIEENYREAGTFTTSNRADLQFGDHEFFIRAYVRRRELLTSP